jgi:1-aminocyclopropane-1-carboxylate deaminase
MKAKSKQCQLETLLASVFDSPYPLRSRTHELRSFGRSGSFVKRDDELGFGISGSKIRKYASLIPFLLKTAVEEVAVIGSAHSNNVLGITQLLIENGIRPALFLKKNHDPILRGNLLLTQLLVPEENIHWIESAQWKNVERHAQEYIKGLQIKGFVLAEGSSTLEALPGALTLAVDIVRNETERGLEFNHIFIDAGTGLMAIALILGYSWILKPSKIHVLLLAGNSTDFLETLKTFHAGFEVLTQTTIPFPNNFELHKPIHSPAFGSVSAGAFQEIIQTARQEGFFLDPIYTAKLFTESRRIIMLNELKGNVLINHSGGGLTLSGFQEILVKSLF